MIKVNLETQNYNANSGIPNNDSNSKAENDNSIFESGNDSTLPESCINLIDLGFQYCGSMLRMAIELLKNKHKEEIDQNEKTQLENEENQNKIVDLNKQIDDYNQGPRGDCWLLSTLSALNGSESGKKLISDSITLNDNSATVTFPGIGYSVEIPNEVINDARNSGNYTTGDDDVVLMELAVEDAFSKIRNGEFQVPEELQYSINDNSDVLRAGYLSDLMYLMTGKLAHEEVNMTFWDRKFPGYELGDVNAFKDRIGGDMDYALDLKTNNPEGIVEILSMETDHNSYHAYSVKSISDDGYNITLVDPVNSSDEIIYTRDELRDRIVDIEYVQL